MGVGLMDIVLGKRAGRRMVENTKSEPPSGSDMTWIHVTLCI